MDNCISPGENILRAQKEGELELSLLIYLFENLSISKIQMNNQYG
jgi:hypothetical protein